MIFCNINSAYAACTGFPAGISATDHVTAMAGLPTSGQRDHMITLHGVNGIAGMLTYDPATNTLQLCDGTAWQALATGAGGGGTLASLTDTNITSPADNSLLRYDSGTSKWIDVALQDGMGATTMTSGWPDTIKCSGTSGDVIFAYAWQRTDGDRVYQPFADDVDPNIALEFNSDGSYELMTNTGWSAWMTSCASKSIAQLYTDGQAFNFIGGGNVWTKAGTVAHYMAGNVGIGTTAPGAKLEVVSASPLRLRNGASDGFSFTQYNTNTWGWTALTAGSTFSVVDANVGIGTTSPSTKFYLQDDVSNDVMTIDGPNGVIGKFGAHSLSNGGVAIDSATANQDLRLRTQGADRLTIVATSGNVGIGTTTPTNNRLVIEASTYNAAKRGILTTGRSGPENPSVGYNVRYGSTANAYTYDVTDLASMIRFQTGKVETFTANSGTVGNTISFTTGPYVAVGGTTWTAGSDVRLKKNIKPITVLDKLAKFRAVSFDWKETGKHDLGVIAQEMYKIFPEVVDKGDDDVDAEITSTSAGKWGVQYDKLGALALQGLKELKAANDNLKAENADLRGALDELRGRVEKLEYVK
ncbi:MAG: tail fiber domain-containing protein [Nitrospiraceae bacterium]